MLQYVMKQFQGTLDFGNHCKEGLICPGDKKREIQYVQSNFQIPVPQQTDKIENIGTLSICKRDFAFAIARFKLIIALE